jgi:hypothetical protein
MRSWPNCSLRFLLVLVGLLAAGDLTARAQQSVKLAQPPFQIAGGDPLSFTWEKLQKGAAAVEIQNNTTTPRRLQITVSDLGFKGPDGKAISNATVIKVEPVADNPGPSNPTVNAKLLQLPPAGIAKIRIAAANPGLTLDPHSYTGTLTVYESSSNTVLRRSIQIAVEAKTDKPAKIKPEPLVTELTINYYRWLPLTNSWFCCPWAGCDCLLPLKKGPTNETVDLENNQVLGGVQRDLGGAALVVRGDIVTQDDSSQLRLKFKDLDFAGKYKGKIDLSSDPKEPRSVNLTINAKDVFLVPIAVIAIGVFLALRTKQYLGSRRTIFELRGQEAALGEKYQRCQAKFSADSQGHPYASYSIATDFGDNRQTLIKKIDGLQQSTYVTLDTTSAAYKEILEDLKSLGADLDAWATFAGKLAALERGIENANRLAAALPADLKRGLSGPNPSFLSDSINLLEGKEITLSDLRTNSEAITETRDFAALWEDLIQELQADWDQLTQLKKHSATLDKQQMTEADDKLRDAANDLWKAKTSQDMEDRATKTDILEAETIMSALIPDDEAAVTPHRAIASLAPPGDARPRIFGHFAGKKSFIAERNLRDASTSDTDRRLEYERRMHAWDFRLAILAFVIAVLAGLNTHYLNKPFGTISDYVTLLLYGVGVKATLDTIYAAIDKVLKRA